MKLDKIGPNTHKVVPAHQLLLHRKIYNTRTLG